MRFWQRLPVPPGGAAAASGMVVANRGSAVGLIDQTGGPGSWVVGSRGDRCPQGVAQARRPVPCPAFDQNMRVI